MFRNPWEIDWSDPQQATQAQRPLIQRPREAPMQTGPQAQGDVLGNVRTQQQIASQPLQDEGQRLTNAQRQRELTRLPDNMQRELSADIDSYDALSRAISGFNDDFSGLGSGIENTVQGGFSQFGTPGQRQWWADFRAADNAIRNRLFGASLSEGERAAYGATTISPNMDAAEVRRNLQARQLHAREALQRRFAGMRAQGYDEAALRALLGNYGDILDAQQPQSRQDATPPGVGALPPSGPGAPNSREILDTHNQATMPAGATQPALNAEVDIRRDPALRGLNAGVNRLLQQRRPIGDIVRYLRERGANPQGGMGAVVNDLRRIQVWQRQHPDYNGPYEIQLENYEVRLDPVTSAMARGAQSGPGTAAGTYINDITGQHLDNIVNAAGGNGALVDSSLAQLQSEHPGGAIAGHIGAGASLYGAGRAAAGRILGRALPTSMGTLSPGAMAGDAALGGYIESGGNGTDVFSPGRTAQGALLAAAGGVAGRGAINTAGRAVSPTGGELAPLYREGVEPSIGQRMGGVVNRAEQGLASIPFIGGVQRRSRDLALQQAQRGAFNQALRDIGQQLPDNVGIGIPAHRYMQNAFNHEFRDIRSQMRFSPDGQYSADFGAIQQEVLLLPEQSQNVFNSMVRNQIGNRLRARGGTLTGNDYVQLASRLDAKARSIRNNPNGDRELAAALESLSNAVDAAAARQSAPELAQRLVAARRGYQKAIIVEDAARRRGGEAGTFSPAHLNAAVQSIGGGLRSRQFLAGNAPMQDYAQSSLRLGQTLADSGTAERLMTMGSGAAAVGATGGGSLLSSPIFAAPWAANTFMNLPGIRKGVNALLAPNRSALNGMRAQIQDRAYLGSMLGYPLLATQGPE